MSFYKSQHFDFLVLHLSPLSESESLAEGVYSVFIIVCIKTFMSQLSVTLLNVLPVTIGNSGMHRVLSVPSIIRYSFLRSARTHYMLLKM